MKSEREYVYVLSNQVMPGLIKIGSTSRFPHERCDELQKATACPGPFKLLAYAQVPDARLAEASMHSDLDEFRYNSRREFFRCRCPSWAALAILTHPKATQVGGDAAVVREIAESSWLEFQAWELEDADRGPDSLFVCPPATHPEVGINRWKIPQEAPYWPWLSGEHRAAWLRRMQEVK